MIVLQALLAWLSRSIGRFFQAAFGWAVLALFGPRPKREQTILSLAVAAAAAWPVLVLGIVLPRVATFVLAFVPLSREVDRGVLRAVWAAAALAVPVGIGLLLGKHAAERGESSVGRRIAQGFPATLGVACAFVFVAVAAPVRKLVAFARRRVAMHVPVVVELEAYEALARVVEGVLRRAGLGMTRGPAPFAEEVPIRVLRAVGGPIFRRQLPERLAAFRGNSLSVVISPNGLALRGPEFVAARVRGLLAEALTFSPALQTLDPEAQKLEKRLKALVDGGNPDKPRLRSTDSLERVAEKLLTADVPEDDWQVLHRELLQAACAREGREPLLVESAGHAQDAAAVTASASATPTPVHRAPRSRRAEARQPGRPNEEEDGGVCEPRLTFPWRVLCKNRRAGYALEHIMAFIEAVATALPDNVITQEDARAEYERLFAGNPAVLRLLRVFDSGVKTRHLAFPRAYYLSKRSFEERNADYVEVGTALAETAARRCLDEAGVAPESVDHLFFVTTTGLATPSVDALLAPRLGLRRDARRWPLFGLGCAGGAGALIRAAETLQGAPGQRALVVSVELCGQVFSPDATNPTDVIGTALFGDGAAAVLLGGDEVRGHGPRIEAARTELFDGTRHIMGWDFTSDGMRLAPLEGRRRPREDAPQARGRVRAPLRRARPFGT